MVRISDITRYVISLVRPADTGQRSFPRVDFVVMTFAAAGAVVLIAADIFQRWIWRHPIETLNIDGAYNPETWFHTMILAGAALAAVGIAFTFFDNRRRLQWLLAGAGIGFLSMDKATSLHERAGDGITDALGLPASASRIVWEITWSPIILAIAAVLIVCVWESDLRTKLWVGIGLALGATKVGLEGLMFPVLYYGATTYSENIHKGSGWLYGVEVQIEETVQLLAFAAFLAAFSQLFVRRLAGVELADSVPVAEHAETRESAQMTGRRGATAADASSGAGVARTT